MLIHSSRRLPWYMPAILTDSGGLSLPLSIRFLLGLLPPLREFDQPDASSAILASWSDQEIDELLECKICYTVQPLQQLPSAPSVGFSCDQCSSSCPVHIVTVRSALTKSGASPFPPSMVFLHEAFLSAREDSGALIWLCWSRIDMLPGVPSAL